MSKRRPVAVFQYPTEQDALRQVTEIQPFVLRHAGTGGRTCTFPISPQIRQRTCIGNRLLPKVKRFIAASIYCCFKGKNDQ